MLFDDYIVNAAQRFELYKRLSIITNRLSIYAGSTGDECRDENIQLSFGNDARRSMCPASQFAKSPRNAGSHKAPLQRDATGNDGMTNASAWLKPKSQMIPLEQRADEIARVVSESRLATLQLEARAALELAKKTLAAVQGNSIDLETLEDIILAQEYRLNLWPTPKPAEESEVKQHLILHFGHEPQPTDGTPYIELKLPDQLPRPARHVLPADGTRDHPPPAE